MSQSSSPGQEEPLSNSSNQFQADSTNAENDSTNNVTTSSVNGDDNQTVQGSHNKGVAQSSSNSQHHSTVNITLVTSSGEEKKQSTIELKKLLVCCLGLGAILFIGGYLASFFSGSLLERWNEAQKNLQRTKISTFRQKSEKNLELFNARRKRHINGEIDDNKWDITKQIVLWSAIKTAYDLKQRFPNNQGDYPITSPIFVLQQTIKQFYQNNISNWNPSQHPLWTIDFNDGQIITGGWDRNIYFCDIENTNCDSIELLDVNHIVTSVNFSSSNPKSFLAARQDAGIIYQQINPETPKFTEAPKLIDYFIKKTNNNNDDKNAILSLTYHSKNNKVAIGTWKGKVYWSADINGSGDFKVIDERPDFPIRSVSYHPLKNLLAIASENGKAYFYNLDTKEYKTLAVSRKKFLSTDFSPDGKKVAIAGENGQIYLRQVSEELPSETNFLPTKWNAKQGWVTSVTFSPDNRQRIIASAGWDGTVKLWNYSGNKLAEWNLGSPITDLSFNQKGNMIAVSKLNGGVSYWSIYTLEKLITDGCEQIDENKLQQDDIYEGIHEEIEKFNLGHKEKICPQLKDT